MQSTEIYTTFTKSNVLFIRAGQKWQTRRVIRPQPTPSKMGDGLWVVKTARGIKAMSLINATKQDIEYWTMQWCRWQPGDLLCVKEGYQITGIVGKNVHGCYLSDWNVFDVRLTDAEWQRWTARKFPYRATSARFMYHSLCRIKRPVIRSWVEQVQGISPADCEAEGVTGLTLGTPGCGTGILLPYGEYRNGNGLVYGTPREAFCALWDEINAHRDYGWDSNPWVWAVEFEPAPVLKETSRGRLPKPIPAVQGEKGEHFHDSTA